MHIGFGKYNYLDDEKDSTIEKLTFNSIKQMRLGRKKIKKHKLKVREAQLKLFKVCMFLIICSAIVSCTNARGAYATLKAQGYDNIRITGYRPFTCGRDDSVKTGFTATKDGQTITGTVCEGLLFKGKTVRYD